MSSVSGKMADLGWAVHDSVETVSSRGWPLPLPRLAHGQPTGERTKRTRLVACDFPQGQAVGLGRELETSPGATPLLPTGTCGPPGRACHAAHRVCLGCWHPPAGGAWSEREKCSLPEAAGPGSPEVTHPLLLGTLCRSPSKGS